MARGTSGPALAKTWGKNTLAAHFVRGEGTASLRSADTSLGGSFGYSAD